MSEQEDGGFVEMWRTTAEPYRRRAGELRSFRKRAAHREGTPPVSDPPEDIPHAEDTFEAGYAAGTTHGVRLARLNTLNDAANVCTWMGNSLPRTSSARREQCFACAAAIRALVEKEREG